MEQKANLYCPQCGEFKIHKLSDKGNTPNNFGMACDNCGRFRNINSFRTSKKETMATKKNPITDPTGEKAAAKEASEQRISDRVRAKVEAARAKTEAIGTKAQQVAQQVGTTLQPVTNTVSAVANAVTSTAATAAKTANDVRQALAPTGTGYQGGYQSSQLQTSTDVYGGLKMPEMKFDSLIPSDPLHPEGLPSITQEELTSGLAKYAGAKRAMELYKSSFQYIKQVGEVKQEFHKAQQSVIKAATEGVKVQQEIVRFDKQNVELAVDYQKLEQSNERLKQNQITTTAMQNETAQLALKFEALEGKRDAEIDSIKYQTQTIIQKYLKGSETVSQ